MYKKIILICLAISLAPAWMSHAQADGWGDLKGKFVYTADIPTASKLNITKDPEYCGRFQLVDESLVINPENKGIANIIVMMYLSRGKTTAVCPDLKPADKLVEINNIKCRFEPRISVVLAGQEFVIKNDDTIGHNTKIDTFANAASNDSVPAKGQMKTTFPKPETLPTPVSCSIHPWMRGYLVIKDHPYVAVTDANGEFMIPKLPAGKLTIQFWQERTGYVENVTIGGKKTKLRRDRIELTIKDNESLDLGTIQVGRDELK